MNKYCNKCCTTKDILEFNKDKTKKDGYHTCCRTCRSVVTKIWAATNRHKRNLNNKKWRLKNKDYQNQYNKLRKKKDPLFHTIINLRRRLNKRLYSLKWRKSSSFNKYIGCNKEQLINNLQAKFEPGMTWDNYGKWHIDHIIPLASAKTETELYQLCHYTNLQPLWAEDNIRKGDKWQ